MYDPSIFGHGFPKTEARILGFGNVGVRNAELVSELISELIGDPDGCPLTNKSSLNQDNQLSRLKPL